MPDGGHTNTSGMGTLPTATLSREQLSSLLQSVDELCAIKDGPQSVGEIAFKRLFISIPDTFGIFEFQEADW